LRAAGRRCTVFEDMTIRFSPSFTFRYWRFTRHLGGIG